MSPRIPLVDPQKAQTGEATRAERDSHWWLAYATSLAAIPPPKAAP